VKEIKVELTGIPPGERLDPGSYMIEVDSLHAYIDGDVVLVVKIRSLQLECGHSVFEKSDQVVAGYPFDTLAYCPLCRVSRIAIPVH